MSLCGIADRFTWLPFVAPLLSQSLVGCILFFTCYEPEAFGPRIQQCSNGVKLENMSRLCYNKAILKSISKLLVCSNNLGCQVCRSFHTSLFPR